MKKDAFAHKNPNSHNIYLIDENIFCAPGMQGSKLLIICNYYHSGIYSDFGVVSPTWKI